MVKAPVSLTSLSEEQRAEAYARFELLRPTLEKGVSQAQVARTHQLSKSAVQRWVKRYREQGLAGLVTTALTTALTLRQAIWRKEDPRWSACGIPSVFYTDHGSDFTSKHLEQVAADIRMELVFSEKAYLMGLARWSVSSAVSISSFCKTCWLCPKGIYRDPGDVDVSRL